MHLNGENCLNVVLREKLAGNGQMDLRFLILKKIWNPGVCVPPPRGNLHAYYRNIQRYSSLKPLGQSKPNFMWSIVRKGERKFI